MFKNGFFPFLGGTNYALTPTQAAQRHRKDFTVFSNLDHGNTGGHQGVPVLLGGLRPLWRRDSQRAISASTEWPSTWVQQRGSRR